jgi:hypothetical protein
MSLCAVWLKIKSEHRITSYLIRWKGWINSVNCSIFLPHWWPWDTHVCMCEREIERERMWMMWMKEKEVTIYYCYDCALILVSNCVSPQFM